MAYLRKVDDGQRKDENDKKLYCSLENVKLRKPGFSWSLVFNFFDVSTCSTLDNFQNLLNLYSC